MRAFASLTPRLTPTNRRRIVDDRGAVWDVWNVDPTDLGRVAYDRRKAARTDRAGTYTVHVQPELRHGWLCFQSADEKRRFAPIPPNWHELPESILRLMLSVATRITADDPDATQRSPTD